MCLQLELQLFLLLSLLAKELSQNVAAFSPHYARDQFALVIQSLVAKQRKLGLDYSGP